MSILISIALVVLFFLLVFLFSIIATPTDYYYERGKYILEHPRKPNILENPRKPNILENPRKPKESLYTPFEDFPKDIHTEDEQISRMRRATDKWIYLFPSTFTGQSAKILGTSCGIYETSFSACSCMDFYKRKLPCKHMYKLAFWSKKMNLYDWGIELEGLKIQNRKPTKERLESIKHQNEIDRERQEAYIKEWRTRWAGYNLDSVYAKEQFMASYRLDGMYLIDHTFDDAGNDTVYMDIPREYDNSKSHTVTLSTCTCKDFRHTKEPCRHMYLLATEIGIISPKITINDIEKNTIIDECFENLQEEIVHGD